MKLTRRQTLAAGAALPAAAAMPRAATAEAHTMTDAPLGTWHRTLNLGDMTATTLLDTTMPREDPHSIFGINVDDETFAEVSEDAFLPTETAQFFFTPVLVRAGENNILFDTGMGQGGIARALEDAGLTTGDVTHVVITHMHGDHVGGLMTDGSPTFANAEHITGETEMNYWIENPNDAINNNIVPLRDRFTLIGDGTEIAPGITGMNAFGHTPGHMIYRLDSGERSLVIFADTANHYVYSLAHPDWEVSFDTDKAMAVETRRRVLDMLAADRIPMTGYHMPFPAAGFVETNGDGFRWVPTSYQLM